MIELMIFFFLILALVVAGLVMRLRSESDFADRDDRGWWPGTR